MATYQTFSAPIMSSLAQFQAWAQFFGGGFTTIGWTAQTGHGELPATGTGASYAFTNPVLPTAALNAMGTYTYRGAWVSGQTYPNGSNTANGTADIVTDTASGGNSISYQKITTNVSTNLTTAPHSNSTDWLPIQFEIWKSSGSNSSTLPIYVRLTYTTQGAANNAIRFFFSIGTGIDANGNITGGTILSTSTPVNTAVIDDSTTTSATLAEMDFAGDSDNFRWVLWRGHPTANFTMCTVVDRSRNASGLATNAFFYIGTMYCIAGGNILRSSILTNSAIGTGPISITSGSGWLGLVWSANSPNPFTLFGANPPLPIFPLVGYVASPLLGAVGFHFSDVTDGSVMPVWNYGANHYYLISKTSGSASLQTIDNQGGQGAAVAILWE